MSITGIFLFLILLIILIVAGIYFFNTSKKGNFIDGVPAKKLSDSQQQSNIAFNAYLPQPVWSAFTPNKTPDGNCLAYSASSSQFTPVAASYQSLNLNAGRGFQVSNQTCLDADQIFAQAGSHICQYNNTGSAGSGCILSVPTIVDGVLKFPGERVYKGIVEGVYNGAEDTTPLYASCNYGNTTSTIDPNANIGNLCGGDIGLIAPNFTPILGIQQPESLCVGGINQQNFCIALDTDQPLTEKRFFNVTLSNCDLGNFEQIFRVVRYSIDSNYNLTISNNGNLAAIMYRQNGYYLAPDLRYDFGSKQYIFDELIKSPTKSAKAKTDTVNLILINPKYDTTRNGIYWLLQDQLPDPAYDPATVAPQQYFGCNIYPTDLGTAIPGCSAAGIPIFYRNNVLEPSSSPYPVNSPISPQQIIYIPNIFQLPTTGVTDPQGYWTYLSNQYSINTFFDEAVDPLRLDPILGLQEFRRSIKSLVYYQSCSTALPSICVSNYTPGAFPIISDPRVIYPDTQFLQYTNMPNAMTTGVSPLTPGCQPATFATFFAGNTYNPIVPDNSTLIFTPANVNQQFVNP